LRHAKERNVIERTFGLLKKRWVVLRQPSFFKLKVQVIVNFERLTFLFLSMQLITSSPVTVADNKCMLHFAQLSSRKEVTE